MTFSPVRMLAILAAVGVVVVAIVILVVAGSPASPAAAKAYAAPHFVEEAQAAGVTHAYSGGFEHFVGGGVATFDCNADGLADLYVAGGSEPAGLFVNHSPTGGALSFEHVSSAVTDMVGVTGAYPLDIDGDGIADLAVLRRDENQLLRGLGGCSFENANERWGFDGGEEWTTAFSARWDPGSTWPTLAIGNYLDESIEGGDRLCFDNELWTPAASGAGFAPSTVLSPGWCPLSMLFSDWDRSGRRDLRVSNDRHYYSDYSDGQEQLWRIGPGTDAHAYTEDEGWRRVRVWGMGIASYDLTGDGYPEYFLTSQGDNKLQVLADGPARPTYEDIALRRGAISTRPFDENTSLPSTAWHDQFEDVNNDGFIDLFIAKGNVDAQPDHAAQDPSSLLIGQPDGTFVEGTVEAGIVDYVKSRGAAVVDLNRDGMLDLVVVKRVENVHVYRNVGAGTADAPDPRGSWLELRLSQQGANRDAIGAWIEVRSGGRSQLRELTVGGGHVSGQLTPIHFGFGDATTAEYRVTWPGGEVSDWRQVNLNVRLLVERGVAEPVVLP